MGFQAQSWENFFLEKWAEGTVAVVFQMVETARTGGSSLVVAQLVRFQKPGLHQRQQGWTPQAPSSHYKDCVCICGLTHLKMVAGAVEVVGALLPRDRVQSHMVGST